MNFNEFVLAMVIAGGHTDIDDEPFVICSECEDIIYESDYDFSGVCPICGFDPQA